MKDAILKVVIRSRFALTSRAAAESQTNSALKKYLQLSQSLNEITGSTSIKVKRMLGVDDDMREWSFFEILRHNTIVNNSISANIKRLALNEPEPSRKFDIKKDVMPGTDCGPEQIALFKSSVLNHLEMLKGLGQLKGTPLSVHPIFGPLDAHGWNCLFAFHLGIHLKQAVVVKEAVSTDI